MKDFKYIMALSVLTLAGSVSCYSEAVSYTHLTLPTTSRV